MFIIVECELRDRCEEYVVPCLGLPILGHNMRV